MFLYIGTTENKIGVFQVDEDTGDLIRTVQLVDPVIDDSDLKPSSKGFFSGRPKSNDPVTEWILKHPMMDLIYAFTSFSSQQEAIVTSYQRDSEFGNLTKLGSCSTGGLHASYATFSPDQSTLVVAHQNDGRLTFFDCMANGGVLEAPIKVVETPEVRPGTRATDFPKCLPSLQHCLYSQDGKYLLSVDSSQQTRIWTYDVDSKGVVVSDIPTSKAKLLPLQPFPGALLAFMSTALLQFPSRLRRVSIHPNGRYIYVLFETHNVIQVYEITPQGKILMDCLQEIPCIDPAFFDRSLPPWKQTYFGLGVNAAAEMQATEDGLWVSNRGLKFWGNVDNTMRCYEYQDDGARLLLKTKLSPQGPVRHFTCLQQGDTTKIVAGMNQKDPGIVESFTKRESGSFEKVGEAAVGMNILCVVPIPEVAIQA